MVAGGWRSAYQYERAVLGDKNPYPLISSVHTQVNLLRPGKLVLMYCICICYFEQPTYTMMQALSGF